MRKTLATALAALLLVTGACGNGHNASRQTNAPAGPARAGAAAPHGSGGQTSASVAQLNGKASTPVPASTGLTIFGDALAAGWQNWSWNAQTNLAVTHPVYSGDRALSFTVTTPWDGLYLHTNNAIDTTPYTYLRFAAQATQPGQRYAVVLVDQNDHFIGKPVFIATYGDITAGAWKYYHIPLADLGGAKRLIKGIIFQDGLGHAQKALYLDDIGLQ